MAILNRTALLIAIMMLAGNVLAAPIMFAETQAQTTTGQDFSFMFAGAPMADGGAGLFEFRVDSDFNNDSEYITSWNIEGFAGATDVSNTDVESTVHSFSGERVDWSQSITISSANLVSILSDGAINITVDFSSGVNTFTTNPDPYASVKFSYNSQTVPESGTLGLLCLGLIGLGLARRKQAP